jgi:hypothetical protein
MEGEASVLLLINRIRADQDAVMATLCICIPDDLASNLGRDTGYPD